MASRYTWILDPGHGGLGPGGEYLTPGKRSPQVPPGIYEGDFNRRVCQEIVALCQDFDVTVTNPGPVNCGLRERAEYINQLQKVRKNCVLLSIHANAAKGNGWSSAHGATIFHHPKNKGGKALAEWVLNSFDQHVRVDTLRGIKPARFAILSKTRSIPGVLIECGFMTNRLDATHLASPEGQFEIAFAVTEMVKSFEDRETGINL